MGQLLQMKPTPQSAAFIYELNDVELRGAAHLLARAAVRLQEKYFSDTDNAWETQGHYDAFTMLTLLADNASSYLVLRDLGPEPTETVQ